MTEVRSLLAFPTGPSSSAELYEVRDGSGMPSTDEQGAVDVVLRTRPRPCYYYYYLFLYYCYCRSACQGPDTMIDSRLSAEPRGWHGSLREWPRAQEDLPGRQGGSFGTPRSHGAAGGGPWQRAISQAAIRYQLHQSYLAMSA